MYVHIDGREAAMGEGAADSTSESEAGVQSDAAELLWLSGLAGGSLSCGGHFSDWRVV